MQMRRKNLEKRQVKAIDEKRQLLKNVERQEPLKLMPLVHHREMLVQFKDCTLEYPPLPGKNVLEHFDFSIRRRGKAFMTGRNGCGKTSIIKAILKEEVPRVLAGELETVAGLVISHVPQDASFLSGSLRDFAEEQRIDETVFFTLLRKLDRRKRCCWPRACAKGRICISGTSLLIILMCFPEYRLRSF